MHARVLRYFDEVVRRGSIRRAAEHLHVAPTAINRQILDLEAELGAPLFERIHKRLHLTPLGEIVLAHVRQTLREHDALQARIAEIKGARRGMVTVATTSGLAGALMPSLVHDFRQQHPGIAVRVADLPVDGIVAAVEQGGADLGLGYDLPEVAAFRVAASRDWSIGAVVAPGHPLAAQSSALLAEVAGYPLILPAPTLSIRALVDDAFARQSIDVTPAVESTSVVLIQRLAAAGAGVALLNPLDVMEDRARGTLVFVPLRDGGLQRQTLRLVARARGPMSAAGELMAQAIGTALDGLFR
ncbi:MULTISPECIES: LysR family transcriptional regulator [Cupriavidus]|uniref:LysR family transcriptional regulator n=1 Tax=Cupriavidus campinensis TaxID=151783 RepID=A0AAE9I331_9BURK|nr:MULTISPECIES: LysR family transcriptional regulator [Cupriavidus]TSP14546.1 LysR family transcriptional regulator [Cupriavidus campinensis]URF05356.1 LysR family transcriptional regulator [Cupriavidus campinensis]